MTEETTPTPTQEKTEATTQAPEASAPQNDNPKTQGKKPNERKGRRGGGRDRKPREAKEFEEAILQIDRVTRVVKGGRRLRFRVSVIIGDQKGRVGFGIGKSAEVMIGIQKAVAKAKKNLFQVPIFNGTIPHPQIGEFKSSKVLLFPAPEGKGVIAGGAVRKILELAGVKDVLSKVHGSRNKLNTAYATIDALTALQNQNPFPEKESEENTDTKDEKKETETKKDTPKKAAKKAPAAKKDTKKEAPKKKADKAKTDE